jgi:predicted nucleotidyltransferase
MAGSPLVPTRLGAIFYPPRSGSWKGLRGIMALDLAPRHLDEVRRILGRHAPHARAWAFGSRTSGRARPFSDLDIALEAEGGISLETLARLRDDFSESDLPIKVDVVDWNSLDPEFQDAISSDRVTL